MKKVIYLLLFSSLSLIPVAGHAATAQVRMYCVSVRLSASADEYGDVLELTSTGLRDTGLGELGPPIPFTDPPLPGTDGYLSSILLYDSLTLGTFTGTAYLSLPPMDDLDGNRYPDFFEVAKAVNYDRFCMINISGYGVVYPQVVWTRAAGSKSGTCTIPIADNYWGTFRAAFELTEFTGTLTYTPGSPVVSGTINMAQTGNPSKTITGPINFTKDGTDPYNWLTNQTGTWTGPPVLTPSFTNRAFSRELNWPTNYVGVIEFSDGYEWTYEPYSYWVLSITDLTDSDRDGIPDFSDDAQIVQPPRPPRVSLVKNLSGVQLTIAGDVGHLHLIQEATSLATPDWQTVQSVTLTNDPQTVSLALPSGSRFWRVIAQ